jgi:thiosulfate/3-mercaptopyruvate sulfurtransferase
MKKFVLGLVLGLLMLQRAIAAGSDPLVTVQWLKDNHGREEVLVLDASFPKLHAAGHIPGAVSVPVFGFFGQQLSPGEMQKLIQSWGVSSGKKVVVYDEGGSYMATSLFFELHHHGVPAESLAVLDGGLAKWQASGGAVTKDPTPAPKPGNFRVEKIDESVRVRLPEFLVASGDPARYALVEALTPEQHFGAQRFFDRAGHVPNAILAPSADFFNADKTFKSPEEIRRMLRYLGVRPEQQVLSHCGGGIAATVPFFAMKFMLGYPSVRVYKESQLEWARDERGLPFWTYDAPYLLRDRTWVNGWGGAMLRNFRVSNLSVIDVRPSEAFKQGHVPFSINIPAEVFKRHQASPEKLAEALGAAGVDPAHEAVIVSSGGLNADSALAFVLLERLGQKKVSVLLGSVDDWGLAGLPLEKEAKPARAMAYKSTATKESAKSQYPRVYLATGKSTPARLPDGKVIHVPFAELVSADGTPKPAKDVWATLAKAGVPRYAELVSVSDDPGEAAAGYFLLKLMGYPDIGTVK